MKGVNKMKTIYKAALYCRISREDENGSSQSESIKNQIDFLTKYALDQGWNIIDVYTDDGYTGTNFERPGFQRMIKDAEAGRVNLIATKDMSRLGRDYIETGRFIERYFPENNIRYVAVNDGIDTFEETGGNDMSPFKSVINDMYAKDISKKVRSVFKNKVAAGKFIGAFAPYGYRKDPADRSRLVIDETAAAVIKRIFDMYLGGKGLTAIAHILNAEGVPTPSSYKSEYCNYKNRNSKNTLWGFATIRVILNNPTYAGNLSQGKYRKVSYKSEKLVSVKKDNWAVVENTHEPIVSMEDFEMARQMMKRKVNTEFICRKPPRLLSGFLKCGSCGAYMALEKGKNGIEYYICSGYKKNTSKYCTRHGVHVKDVEKAVLEDVKAMVGLIAGNVEMMKDSQKEFGEKSMKKADRELASYEKKLSEINNYIKNLYMDKVKGIIPEEEFIHLSRTFSSEKDSIVKSYNALQEKLNRQGKEQNNIESVLKGIGEPGSIMEFNRNILERLVEKIEVLEDKNIRITYKFKNPMVA
jgi:site-specific DNA recombinase